MPQSIPSVTTPPPPATLGHLTKSHARGAGFAQIHCPGDLGFDRGWEVAKIQHTGLIPTQNHFSVAIQSTKQNTSVLRTVKYAVMFVINLPYGIGNLRKRIFRYFAHQ